MITHISDDGSQTQEAKANLTVTQTEDNNLRIELRQEHIASKAMTSANLSLIESKINEIMQHKPQSHMEQVRSGFNPQVVFDCSQLSGDNLPFGGLTNFGTLVMKTNRLMSDHRMRGNVEISGVDDVIREALHVTGVSHIVRINETGQGGARRSI